MDSLRLTLILIGLVILALIWMLHRPEGSARKPGATRRDASRRVEPGIGSDADADADDGTASAPTSPSDDDEDWSEDADPAARDSRAAEPRQTMLPDLGSEAPDWSVETIRREDARRVRRTPEPSPDPEAELEADFEKALGALRTPNEASTARSKDRPTGRRGDPQPAPPAKRPLLKRAAELVPRPSSDDRPSRAPETPPAGTRREPELSPPARGDAPARRIEPRWPGDEPEPSKSNAPRERAAPATATGDSPRIVTLYLRARGERLISGLGLLDAAIKAGLRFGEMKIFHRRHQGATKPVFSMANIARPGSFDPSGWNLFETQGVTLFMTLPGPVSGLDAWDAMLATGQRLSELLDADLMDDSQCLLTRQRIAQIREDMREFDRKAGLGK